MTLRAPADFRQMIFASLALLAFGTSLPAQQAPVVHGLKMKGTAAPLPGQILSSDGRIVQFKTQAGSIGYPLASVESVTMPAPPEYSQAQQALLAKDSKKALQLARGIYDKFK